MAPSQDPFWNCRCTLKPDPVYGVAAAIRTKTAFRFSLHKEDHIEAGRTWHLQHLRETNSEKRGEQGRGGGEQGVNKSKQTLLL